MTGLRASRRAAAAASHCDCGTLMAVVATLTLVACGGSKAAPVLSSRPHQEVPLTAPASLSELVVAANSIRATAVRIQGELRVQITGQAQPWSYDLELIAARSGALWLRARSGRDSFEIASDGSVVSLRSDASKDLEQVPAARFPDLTATAPRRRLPLYALIDALLPQVVPELPLGSDDLLASERHPGETRLIWLSRTTSGWRTRRRIAFDAEDRIRWYETFDDSGRRVARVSYRGWRTTPPFFPSRFELEHVSGVTLQVAVSEVRLDPRLEPGVFDLTATAVDG